ncbi:hypothetical protein QBC37DRAFT_193573 [Rhypophila decipiens]|uniref:Uncharacterized protein n=1 Tax=Rhypophila decipiens TaxID=261697 RepID=A0AAN7B6U5_9PEZI|nr:hypothetical protein QBC37DRAFT_193573 [Rhypophila decipiens]
MAEGDTIEVFTENDLASGLQSPDPLPPAPNPCQVVPPCREGNHGIQPSVDTAYRKIGKYYFTEEALRHDLAALKRGKVYTRQEFFPRARAWYKAEIDRILHWHRVYKERNPEKPEEVHVINPKPKSEVIEETIATNEETVKDQTQLVQDEKKEEEGENEEQQVETEPSTQEPKLKTRAKKVKIPVAPTRVQPARAAKRKAIEPQLQKRTAKKKKRVEDSIEAVPPTPEPAETIHVNAEELAENREESTPWTGEQRPNGTQEQPKLQDPSKLQNLEPIQPDEHHVEETKGDYQLSLDEWKVFLARYNSATTPVTPTPSPTSLSAFTLQQLQGLDIANFVLRLERIVETKINQLIDERQGITIDAGAGGGLCLTGYYHHPYKCALDGNYVPPLKFEAAGGYVPGEDWRPEEAQKEDGTGAGEVVGDHSDDEEKVDDKIGEKQDMVESTTGVVSSPRHRPPQTGRRLAERILSNSANASRGVSPFPTRQETSSAGDPAGIPIPGLEAALHRQAQAAAAGDDEASEAARNPNRNEPFQPSQPIQTLRLSSREEDDASRSTSMLNSPAPEAFMDISPTLGRWRPPIPGLPVENFDDAIVDVAGLRFAVDLCAGYLGDGRSARMFML